MNIPCEKMLAANNKEKENPDRALMWQHSWAGLAGQVGKADHNLEGNKAHNALEEGTGKNFG
ncbi:hypothetical protein DSO57_1002064 [Entomophthora muscae]|uniref:Uncharacterized protein n=1 Tax=Entomophthora muscae TaxID=34485 RepID=A0ACC2RZW4_9FUNG|nr:hypothetical protein DSO57_1002064 [Entomophthora muscae]